MRKKWKNHQFWGPQTLQKSSKNRSKIEVPKNMQIYHIFFRIFTKIIKRWPLILSPWPVFRKLFYEIAFEAPTKFWLQKIIKKPLKNHPQTSMKSMNKSGYFWTSYFSRFFTNLGRFGIPKWDQKPEKNLPRSSPEAS